MYRNPNIDVFPITLLRLCKSQFTQNTKILHIIISVQEISASTPDQWRWICCSQLWKKRYLKRDSIFYDLSLILWVRHKIQWGLFSLEKQSLNAGGREGGLSPGEIKLKLFTWTALYGLGELTCLGCEIRQGRVAADDQTKHEIVECSKHSCHVISPQWNTWTSRKQLNLFFFVLFAVKSTAWQPTPGEKWNGQLANKIIISWSTTSTCFKTYNLNRNTFLLLIL